jgi:hypothetical protein
MTTRSSRSFTQRSRERIIAAKIEERLFKFIDGEIEMSRTQVYAAIKILDKVLPSLKSISIEEAEPDERPLREWTTAELNARRAELLAQARGATYEETGYIHKDDLEAMGYVRQEVTEQ